MITLDVITGIVRSTLPLLVAILVAKGLPEITANEIAQQVGYAVIAVVWLGVIVWSAMRNRQSSQIAKVEQFDGVKQIVIDPDAISPPTSSLGKIKITSR